MKDQANEEWRKKLTPEQYRILRQKGTEHPFTGHLLKNKEEGIYVCAGCGVHLFSSDTKFDSQSGWPSFWESVSPEAVEIHDDSSLGMKRVEVKCANCGGHLGHVFDDGPKDTTEQRYCINSAALDFKKAEVDRPRAN